MKQRGFSLLEVLVAFSILSLSLGVLMQLLSTSLRNASVSTDYAVATDLAESLLAEWPVLGVPRQGKSSGRYLDRYQWSIAVEPETRRTYTALAARKFELVRVKVRVSWAEQENVQPRSVMLDTLRTVKVATHKL